MAFVVKRNDRLPALPFQFFQADGITPLNLTAAISVKIVVRPKTAGLDDPPKFKSACQIINAVQGTGQYNWGAADLDTAGAFEYEFEIEWPGPLLQTIPSDSYLELTVMDDIG